MSPPLSGSVLDLLHLQPMQRLTHLSSVPNVPAIYALFGGRSHATGAAYVGIAGKLRQRLEQHLVRRDSSVTTGAAVVSLNPDLVTLVRWWTALEFEDRDVLRSAELIAFDVLNPTLRSRGGVGDTVRSRLADPGFQTWAHDLFSGPPSGEYAVQSLESVVERLDRLADRLNALEARVESAAPRQ